MTAWAGPAVAGEPRERLRRRLFELGFDEEHVDRLLDRARRYEQIENARRQATTETKEGPEPA